MAKDYWIFKRKGATRFTFAWAPDPNKKAKRKQTLLPEHITTEREANRYAELHEDELKGAKPKPRAHGQTVAEMVDRWIKLRKGDTRFAASTFESTRSDLTNWVAKPVGEVDLGSKQPAQLDAPLLRKWVRALRASTTKRGKPPAPFSVRNKLRSLRWFLADVIGEGWATIPGGNPAKDDAVLAELPTLEPLAGRSQKLRLRELGDAQRLIDCPKVRLQWRVRYAVDFTSGLRDGELSGLRVRDIDRVARVACVRTALQLRSHDGPGAQIGRTKTRDAVRTVPLHPAAFAALCEWLDKGWEIHVGRPPEGDDFVFVRRDGSPWRPRSAERFRVHAALAGLPTHVDGHPLTFHALRRSFASWLRQAKVPLEARQVLMGHTPKTAEERHYSEEDPTALAEFVSRIDLVWNRVPSVAEELCDEPKSDSEPLHNGTRARKLRSDFEG